MTAAKASTQAALDSSLRSTTGVSQYSERIGYRHFSKMLTRGSIAIYTELDIRTTERTRSEAYSNGGVQATSFCGPVPFRET
jgi:hypothetical protein